MHECIDIVVPVIGWTVSVIVVACGVFLAYRLLALDGTGKGKGFGEHGGWDY